MKLLAFDLATRSNVFRENPLLKLKASYELKNIKYYTTIVHYAWSLAI